MNLSEAGPAIAGYGCPWCPIVVIVVESDDDARTYMETHMDAHFAHAVGRPTIPAQRDSKRDSRAGAA